MPVAIDEVSAEIVAPEADTGSRRSGDGRESAPRRETVLRRERELHENLHQRAERVRAD